MLKISVKTSHAARSKRTVVLDVVAPDKPGQDVVAPDKLGQDVVAPDKLGQDVVALDKVGPDKMGPGKVDEEGKMLVVPDRVVPDLADVVKVPVVVQRVVAAA